MRRQRSRSRPRPGLAIVLAVLAALVLKFFVVDLAIVDGRSMLPRYRDGDIVVVLRCAYGLRAPFGAPGRSRYFLRWAAPLVGEVIAAANPASGRAVVKRVAAVGPLELRVVGDRLVGGGLDLGLDPGEAAILGLLTRLPKGSVFLLGDNLRESVDSRSYGPVPDDMIAGRVIGGFGGGSAARGRLAGLGPLGANRAVFHD
jgi:signal peptidase I